MTTRCIRLQEVITIQKLNCRRRLEDRDRYAYVRQVSTRHVKMLYVERETCRGLLWSVVSRFRLIEVDAKPVKVVEVVQVLVFVKFR